MPAMIAAFGQTTGIAISLLLGPASLLLERIEAGEPFDLFLSASMARPQRLACLGPEEASASLAIGSACFLMPMWGC